MNITNNSALNHRDFQQQFLARHPKQIKHCSVIHLNSIRLLSKKGLINEDNIKYLNNDQLLFCIKEDLSIMKFVSNKPISFYISAILQNFMVIHNIRKPTNKMYMIAIKEYPRIFREIPLNRRTHEMCLLAVKLDCENIRFVPKQKHQYCWIALQNNITCFKYISNISKSMAFYVIKKAMDSKSFQIRTRTFLEYVPKKFTSVHAYVKLRGY